jgi:hypothetical protein
MAEKDWFIKFKIETVLFNDKNLIDKRYYYATFRDDYTTKDWDDVSKYIVESCGYKGSKHHLDVNYYDIMEDRDRQESEKNKKLWKKFEKYRNNPKITKI